VGEFGAHGVGALGGYCKEHQSLICHDSSKARREEPALGLVERFTDSLPFQCRRPKPARTSRWIAEIKRRHTCLT